MNLSELRKSILDMSTEELMETFRKIRHSRANPPIKASTKKTKTKGKVPTRKSVLNTIDNMSAEQLDALIAQLGGSK